MPATKLRCEFCDRLFWAARRDSKWCSVRCRARARSETAHFLVPAIPRSGVPGVTYYMRINRRWQVRIRETDGAWKYVGAQPTLEAALALQREVLGTNVTKAGSRVVFKV